MLACTGVSAPPPRLLELSRLQSLSLAHAADLVSLPSGLFGDALPSLRHVDLSGCKSLGAVPEDVVEAASLETLLLRGCTSLLRLPEDLRLCAALSQLDLRGCAGLGSLPDLSVLPLLRVELDGVRHRLLEPWEAGGRNAFNMMFAPSNKGGRAADGGEEDGEDGEEDGGEDDGDDELRAGEADEPA